MTVLEAMERDFSAQIGERPTVGTKPSNVCGCAHPEEPTCPARLCVCCCGIAHGPEGHLEPVSSS